MMCAMMAFLNAFPPFWQEIQAIFKEFFEIRNRLVL